jgi:hypothetical protein
MKREINWELNTIRGGNHGPFVYRDADGIHVGDCDNHEVFASIAEAIQYAERARLSGNALGRARQHAEDDARDNDAAEYSWHEDAGLQLDALIKL